MRVKRIQRKPPSKKKQRAILRRNVLLLVILVGVAVWLVHSFSSWPALHAKSVVVSGERRVGALQIRQAAAIKTTDNIWLLNTWAISHRIEAIPYILTAHVKRLPPNSITIEVTERTPDGCIRTRGGYVTIDGTQRVLDPGCSAPTIFEISDLRLPQRGETVTDPMLGRLRSDASLVSATGLVPHSLMIGRDGDLVVVARDGMNLLLGTDDDLADKTHLVAPIINAVSRQGRVIGQLDLRAPSTPVVRYKESGRTSPKRPATR